MSAKLYILISASFYSVKSKMFYWKYITLPSSMHQADM